MWKAFGEPERRAGQRRTTVATAFIRLSTDATKQYVDIVIPQVMRKSDGNTDAPVNMNNIA
jgi:hypothetical protein